LAYLLALRIYKLLYIFVLPSFLPLIDFGRVKGAEKRVLLF
jgi:hypothetical protein